MIDIEGPQSSFSISLTEGANFGAMALLALYLIWFGYIEEGGILHAQMITTCVRGA